MSSRTRTELQPASTVGTFWRSTSPAGDWGENDTTVFEYFDQRGADLLVFDLLAGDGSAQLAPFLGCRAPHSPFPWENAKGAGTYRPEPRLRALGRRPGDVAGEARRLAGWR